MATTPPGSADPRVGEVHSGAEASQPGSSSSDGAGARVKAKARLVSSLGAAAHTARATSSLLLLSRGPGEGSLPAQAARGWWVGWLGRMPPCHKRSTGAAGVGGCAST